MRLRDKAEYRVLEGPAVRINLTPGRDDQGEERPLLSRDRCVQGRTNTDSGIRRRFKPAWSMPRATLSSSVNFQDNDDEGESGLPDARTAAA
jgi:hypothetical protein